MRTEIVVALIGLSGVLLQEWRVLSAAEAKSEKVEMCGEATAQLTSAINSCIERCAGG